jgi:hypothetical protein
LACGTILTTLMALELPQQQLKEIISTKYLWRKRHDRVPSTPAGHTMTAGYPTC